MTGASSPPTDGDQSMPGPRLSLPEREEIHLALTENSDATWASIGRRVGRPPDHHRPRNHPQRRPPHLPARHRRPTRHPTTAPSPPARPGPDAVRRLHCGAGPVTYAAVASAAHVCRSWLYRQPDLRAEIDRLRATGRSTTPASPRPSEPPQSRTDDGSWPSATTSSGSPRRTEQPDVKRIKRIGFGLRRFRHYRVRALLYAGRPN